MQDYLYALIMYEIGEDHEAASALNILVESGDTSFLRCNGRTELMAYLRSATAGAEIDMEPVADRLRLWLRLGGLFSDEKNEKHFAALCRIMHELGYGPKMKSLCRDVERIELLRQEAAAGRIDVSVYQAALQQLVLGGRLGEL